MPYEKKRSKPLIILLAALVVVLIGCIVAALYFFMGNRTDTEAYHKQIHSAEKYLAENDYENAILSYQAAIEAAPEEEDAYLALAEIYQVQNDIESAQTILKQGYLKTGSVRINKMLALIKSSENSLITAADSGEAKTTTLIASVNVEEASKNTAWNTSLVQKWESYTYADFSRDYNRYDSAEVVDGALVLQYTSAGITCYYENTEDNKDIVDLSQKRVADGAMPSRIELSDISILFRNFNGAVSKDRLEIMIGHRADIKADGERSYIEFTTSDCLFRIECDSDGNIIKTDAWNEIELLNANLKAEEDKEYSGVVVDAVTGMGVQNADVRFTGADGSTASAKTGADGTFTLEIADGSYEVEVSCDGYIGESFDIEVKDSTRKGGQFIISPALTEGQVRIVLEWEASPWDLDSYLFGSTDAGDSVVVSYMRKQAVSSGGQTIAELDVDCTSGYGPETTTIYDLNGVYTFEVADFNVTGTMGQTNATVKVYMPGESAPTVITINPQVVDKWKVFELDHGELKVVNEPSTRGSVSDSK